MTGRRREVRELDTVPATFPGGRFAWHDGRRVKLLGTDKTSTRWRLENGGLVATRRLANFHDVALFGQARGSEIEILDIRGDEIDVRVSGSPGWARERGGAYDHYYDAVPLTLGRDEISEPIEVTFHLEIG